MKFAEEKLRSETVYKVTDKQVPHDKEHDIYKNIIQLVCIICISVHLSSCLECQLHVGPPLYRALVFIYLLTYLSNYAILVKTV